MGDQRSNKSRSNSPQASTISHDRAVPLPCGTTPQDRRSEVDLQPKLPRTATMAHLPSKTPNKRSKTPRASMVDHDPPVRPHLNHTPAPPPLYYYCCIPETITTPKTHEAESQI
mmetsp:Transcript_34767/g.70328  ORF Transcript_34767/g.70328 Transcript_34767/m.70328 type:complete len:114 (+) Transcript_34767:2485-2826(+)